MLFYERCVEKGDTANDVCFEGKGYIRNGWLLGTRRKTNKHLVHPTRERRTRREINDTRLTSH